MTRYLLTLKDGTQTTVEADSYSEAILEVTNNMHDVANVQELGVEYPDNGASS